ncbi:NAD(P)-binding Rossmann-fold superfamily protein [Wolffia australiana]
MASPSTPVFLDAAKLTSLLPFPALFTHLQSSLSSSSSIESPLRHIHTINPSSSSSLLLMPAWSLSSPPYLGVKLVTSFPLNSPSVHATYNLFSATSGAPLATMDGTQLTLLRTAAVSALAASHLARPGSRVLLLLGAGSLAPHLARAHLRTLPSLRRVVVWNRTPDKARLLAARLAQEEEFITVEVATEIRGEVVGEADIVCCATGSEVALVKGRELKVGAHLDLVGSFKEGMRECDGEAVRRGRVFVDSAAAMEEAGELVAAFASGEIGRGDVVGSLRELVSGVVVGRTTEEEITVFKSVGSAAVDLLAAQLAYENFLRGEG